MGWKSLIGSLLVLSTLSACGKPKRHIETASASEKLSVGMTRGAVLAKIGLPTTEDANSEMYYYDLNGRDLLVIDIRGAKVNSFHCSKNGLTAP